MANKLDNLLKEDRHEFTHEEQVAGGIASGKARQEKATMKKALQMLLDEKNDKGITYRDLSTLGLIKGATQGKAENYKLICQILGELDTEEQVGTPQVNINIVDNTNLEKALYEDENE